MKRTLLFFLLTACLGLLLVCTGNSGTGLTNVFSNQAEKSSVIYLVRHAEKSNNHPTDPDLSKEGRLRALVLKDSLHKLPISAIYTSPYKRTQQTAAPLAKAKNLKPVIYQPHDFSGLAATIRKRHQNETVLVVGHSDTVLEIVEAFKAPRPIPELRSADYNYLFKITLAPGKEPQVEVKQYGL